MPFPYVFAKLAGAKQAAQIPYLAGKSFTVIKVTSAKALGGVLLLSPTVGNGGIVAIKLEGAKQAAALAPLAGKTVTIAKTPVGVGNLIALKPITGAAVAKGAAGVGATQVAFTKGTTLGAGKIVAGVGVKKAALINPVTIGAGKAVAGKVAVGAGIGMAGLTLGGLALAGVAGAYIYKRAER